MKRRCLILAAALALYAALLSVIWGIASHQAAKDTEAQLDYAILDFRSTISGAIDTMLDYVARTAVRNIGSARELTLALEETARYLVYLGVTMETAGGAGSLLPRAVAFDAYETFEALTEAALPGMTRLYAALTENTLRLVTDALPPAVLPDAPLPVTVTQSEGLTYFAVPLKGGNGA